MEGSLDYVAQTDEAGDTSGDAYVVREPMSSRYLCPANRAIDSTGTSRISSDAPVNCAMVASWRRMIPSWICRYAHDLKAL